MNRTIHYCIIFLFFLLVIAGCNTKHSPVTIKLSANDPFKKTMIPDQGFEIDGRQDNIVEGENGTIIVCPKGCFINRRGEIVEGMVKIELSEALSIEDMLLSNLTTSSNDQPLETDGMIYFNATADGDQLTINKEIPVHIEIPTTKKKPGMMAYKGSRDDKGNMNWTDPQQLDNYLITVDMQLLDFLPSGFQVETDKGMPFRGHVTASKSLTDSLYYSLSVSNGSDMVKRFAATNYNEPYYNKSKEVINGKYTDRSYEVNAPMSDSDMTGEDTLSLSAGCGIDPAIIQVISSEKYQNTFIATREFEARLKVIFKTCNNTVLETYIRNLDKNLYEADSLAAIVIGGGKYHDDFINFSKQRLTKVKEADRYADLLKEYYEKQLAKVKAELESNENKYSKKLDKKNAEAEKVADDYKRLLLKREKYRMETYSFKWTQTGWVNIDIPKGWFAQPLEITVENGKGFNHVYTYVIFTSIKSLYRLNTTDNVNFYAGNDEKKEMLMPELAPGIAISIGYNGETPSFSIREFVTGAEPKMSLSLIASTLDEVKKAIRPYDKYARENELSRDIEFQTKFYQEGQRQKKLIAESEFIMRLWKVAFPCCNDELSGERLFLNNCSRCHVPGHESTGPDLANSTSIHSKEWLYKWTVNSTAVIESGDPYAIELFKKYGSVQPSFQLSEEQVSAIFEYIDNIGI